MVSFDRFSERRLDADPVFQGIAPDARYQTVYFFLVVILKIQSNRIIHSDLIRAGFFRYDLSVLQHIFQIANTAFIPVLILLSSIIFEVFAQVTLCARLLDRLDRLFADHQLPMVDLFLNLLYITFCQLLSHVLLCQSLFFYHFYNLCYIFSADFIRRCLDHHADQRLRTTRTN